MKNFKKWFEATDIFGFEKAHTDESPSDFVDAKPIRQFDLELMMEYLSKKSIGLNHPFSPFISEMTWGNDLGSIKLEVDTGLTFYVKKKAKDLLGEDRWITKKIFQLNRHGYGGLEDSVAQEIFNHLELASKEPSPAATHEFDKLEELTLHIYSKMKRVAKDIFMPAGIKKINDNAYVISFEPRGQGAGSPDQRKVEVNQTMVSYDESSGVIRIFNYNLESPMGGERKLEIMENDLDLYFFPTQDREEISECLAVHMKYY